MPWTLPPRVLSTIMLVAAFTVAASASRPEDQGAIGMAPDAPAEARYQAHLLKAGQLLAAEPAVALKHAHAALGIAERLGNDRLELEALRAKGRAERACGSHGEFTRTILRSVETARGTGDPVELSRELRSLSLAYQQEGLRDKAVEEARNATALVMPTRDPVLIAEAHLHLLDMLVVAGHYQEAIRTGERFLQRSSDPGSKVNKAEAAVRARIARALLLMGKPGDALPYLTMAMRQVDASTPPGEHASLLLDQARAAMGLGLYIEAEHHLKAARTVGQGSPEGPSMLDLIAAEVDLAKHQGRWAQAVDLLEELHRLGSEAQHQQVNSQLAALRVLHETERHASDNHRLRELDRENKATIEGQRAYTLYLLAGLVLLALLSISLFASARYSLRTARRLRLKNELVRRQSAEIEERNLELKRERARMAEALLSDEQKETIIKEIHHRVKNNLQVLDSLLGIQAITQDDPRYTDLLREAQGRIRSMAQVHEQLYRAAGRDGISLRAHLEELSRKVLMAFGAHHRISVLVESCEPAFTPEVLLHLSLMVNELLTNSVKYAFTGEGAGSIRIVVRPAGNGYELIYADTGETQQATTSTTTGFGSELLRVLAEQLNGELRPLKGRGTAYGLTFVPEGRTLRKAS